MLEITGLECRYGKVSAVRGLSMVVNQGELVTLIGANGAGKSTTLKAISGLLPPAAGRIVFDGRDISNASAQRILSLGIAHCPEGRRIFPYMSVQENLDMGCYLRRDADGIEADRQRVFERFPILEGRRRQTAGTLSGGEQQMLAIGRALLLNADLMLMDEPSEGLAPTIVEQLVATSRRLVTEGIAVLLVEQNLSVATAIAERQVVMVSGQIETEISSQELLEDADAQRRYLGVESLEDTEA